MTITSEHLKEHKRKYAHEKHYSVKPLLTVPHMPLHHAALKALSKYKDSKSLRNVLRMNCSYETFANEHLRTSRLHVFEQATYTYSVMGAKELHSQHHAP